MTDVSKDAAGAAEVGASWLDQVYPGWHTAVNVANLRVSSLTHCPLAQAAGDGWWGAALSRLREDGHPIGVPWLMAHGFIGVGADLTLAWRAEVLKRCLTSPPGSHSPALGFSSEPSSVGCSF